MNMTDGAVGIQELAHSLLLTLYPCGNIQRNYCGKLEASHLHTELHSYHRKFPISDSNIKSIFHVKTQKTSVVTTSVLH